MAYTKQAHKRYLVEVVCVVAAIIGAMRLRRALETNIAPELMIALKLVPVAGVVLIAVIMFRLYRRRDELQRAIMLKGAALAGLFGFVAFTSYPLLMPIGAPPLSALAAVLIMSAAAASGAVVMNFFQVRQESGWRAALCQCLLMPASFAAPPLTYWSLSQVMALPSLTLQHGLLYGAGGAAAFSLYRIFIRPTDQ